MIARAHALNDICCRMSIDGQDLTAAGDYLVTSEVFVHIQAVVYEPNLEGKTLAVLRQMATTLVG